MLATKKQKRARTEAKREEFLSEVKRSGLEALLKDREHRARKNLEEWQANHDKNHSWKKRIKECPHCELELKASRGSFTTKDIQAKKTADGKTNIKETI